MSSTLRDPSGKPVKVIPSSAITVNLLTREGTPIDPIFTVTGERDHAVERRELKRVLQGYLEEDKERLRMEAGVMLRGPDGQWQMYLSRTWMAFIRTEEGYIHKSQTFRWVKCDFLELLEGEYVQLFGFDGYSPQVVYNQKHNVIHYDDILEGVYRPPRELMMPSTVEQLREDIRVLSETILSILAELEPVMGK